jgi:hypothetical protein
VAIRLRRPDETVEVKVGAEGEASVFVLRPLTHARQMALRRENTLHGRVDEEALEWATWRSTLVGWREVFDEKGDPLPFTEENRERLIREMPSDLATLLLAHARLPAFRLHEAVGNSGASSLNGKP